MKPIERIVGIALAFLLASLFGVHAQTSDYKLAPSDILGVEVFQEPTLTTEVQVSATGDITYPLLGQLKVGGKTPVEVQKELQAKLEADYLVNPHVIVKVITYRLRKVSVTGQVNLPRAIELPAEQKLTMLQAIAEAGGFNPRANRKKILLLREGKQARTFSEDELTRQLIDNQAVYLEPGDIIKVEESFF